MTDRPVFIDETGTPGCSGKPGSSQLFVVAAVVVEPQHEKELREFVGRVRTKYVPKKEELKFSRTKSKDRLKLVGELGKLPFTFYAVVVNKSALRSPGLVYASVFYKFFFGMLIKTVGQRHGLVEIHYDEYGNAKFRESLEKYVRKRFMPMGLFKANVIVAHDSRDCELTQIADLVVGAIGRAVGAHQRRDWSYLQRLAEQNRGVIFWPPTPHRGVNAEIASEDSLAVQRESERRARLFAATQQRSEDEKRKWQVYVCEYLLYEDEYVPAQELLHCLEEAGLDLQERDAEKKKRWLQRFVIAPLRDAGVLIASRVPPNYPGYKLIRRIEEADEYYHQQWKIASSIIRRAEEVRMAVGDATAGRVEIRHFGADVRLRLRRAGIEIDMPLRKLGNSS